MTKISYTPRVQEGLALVVRISEKMAHPNPDKTVEELRGEADIIKGLIMDIRYQVLFR